MSRDQYCHSFTKRVLDLGHEVLMGDEMWDKLGGEGTYDALLEVIERVKQVT
jgi:hypothetical protein